MEQDFGSRGRRAIVALLLECGPLRATEIGAALGRAQSSVIRTMREHGGFVRTGDWRWAVAGTYTPPKKRMRYIRRIGPKAPPPCVLDVRQVLARGPMTKEQIADRSGYAVPTVRDALRFIGARKNKRGGRGTLWSLA
jgi:hypothetical protein